jgi:hypothetical protein
MLLCYAAQEGDCRPRACMDNWFSFSPLCDVNKGFLPLNPLIFFLNLYLLQNKCVADMRLRPQSLLSETCN